jgi:sulfide:quinone oxidoreductase
MRIVQLSDNYSVTMQIDPEDVGAFAQEGYTTIICNRPDGEELRQPSSASVREACERHGIAFHMIPMRGSAVSPEILQQFLDVIQNADGPILGYCRSGTRSAILWQIASQAQSQ